MASEYVALEFRVIPPRCNVMKQVFDVIESYGPDEVQWSALAFFEVGASSRLPEEKRLQTWRAGERAQCRSGGGSVLAVAVPV